MLNLFRIAVLGITICKPLTFTPENVLRFLGNVIVSTVSTVGSCASITAIKNYYVSYVKCTKCNEGNFSEIYGRLQSNKIINKALSFPLDYWV